MGWDFSYLIVEKDCDIPSPEERTRDNWYDKFVNVPNLRNRWSGPVSEDDDQLIRRYTLYKWFMKEFFENSDFISIHGWCQNYDGQWDIFVTVGEILSQMKEGDRVYISYF